jgi:hypothetical protein
MSKRREKNPIGENVRVSVRFVYHQIVLGARSPNHSFILKIAEPFDRILSYRCGPSIFGTLRGRYHRARRAGVDMYHDLVKTRRHRRRVSRARSGGPFNHTQPIDQTQSDVTSSRRTGSVQRARRPRFKRGSAPHRVGRDLSVQCPPSRRTRFKRTVPPIAAATQAAGSARSLSICTVVPRPRVSLSIYLS